MSLNNKKTNCKHSSKQLSTKKTVDACSSSLEKFIWVTSFWDQRFSTEERLQGMQEEWEASEASRKMTQNWQRQSDRVCCRVSSNKPHQQHRSAKATMSRSQQERCRMSQTKRNWKDWRFRWVCRRWTKTTIRQKKKKRRSNEKWMIVDELYLVK